MHAGIMLGAEGQCPGAPRCERWGQPDGRTCGGGPSRTHWHARPRRPRGIGVEIDPPASGSGAGRPIQSKARGHCCGECERSRHRCQYQSAGPWACSGPGEDAAGGAPRGTGRGVERSGREALRHIERGQRARSRVMVAAEPSLRKSTAQVHPTPNELACAERVLSQPARTP